MARINREASLVSSLFAAGLYKRNQGRLVRQCTVAALLVLIVVGCWTLSVRLLAEMSDPVRIGVPVALGVLGAWAAFRLVNYPQFADFLIEVEVELGKVSWPGRDEVWRATGVVLVVMAVLGGVLFAYDLLWQQLLRLIGVLRF